MRCSVRKCPNKDSTKLPDCSFFTFPTDKKLLKIWMQFCNREKISNPRGRFICMDHFKKDDFENNLKYEMGFAMKRMLKRGAIPTLNREPGKVDYVDEERKKRIEQRRNKKVVESLLREYDAALATSKETIEESCYPLLENVTTVQENDPLEIDNIVEDFVVELEGEEEEEKEEEAEENILDENVEANVKSIDHFKKVVEGLQREIYNLRQQNIRLRNSEQKCIARLREKGRNHSNTIREYVLKIQTLKLNLQKAYHINTHMEDQLAGMFTKGQIQKIKNGFKRKTWTKADISHCIDLYVASPKAYRLLYVRGFPIPAIRTLQKWNQKGITT